MAHRHVGDGKRDASQPLSRRLTGELVGTFVLTFVAAGADIVNALSGEAVGHVARYAAPGIAVMAMIWSLSGLSGAHINPAVTIAFFLRGSFAGRLVAAYVAAQLVGAVLAGLILRLLFGAGVAAGITAPSAPFTAGVGFSAEIALSFILVFVILATADQKAVVGKNAALAVGGVVTLCGFAFSPLSGASMNPARSLGPMAAALDFHLAPLYIFGPIAGAAIAVGVARVLYGPPSGEDRQAAQGA